MLALILSAALAIGACDDDLEEGETLSKDEYIDRGHELCEEVGDRNAQAFEELGEDPDPGEYRTYVSETLMEQERLIDDLRKGIPEGDEAEMNQILDQFQDYVDETEARPELAHEGYRIVPIQTAFGEYGLTECP